METMDSGESHARRVAKKPRGEDGREGISRSRGSPGSEECPGEPLFSRCPPLDQSIREALLDLGLVPQAQPTRRSIREDRSSPTPNRGEFFDGYYTANLPVIITGMMDDWRSRNERQLEDVARRLAALPGDAEKLIDEDDWKEQLSEATDDLPPFREYLGAGPRGRHDPAQSRRHEQPFPAESGEHL